MYFVYIITNKVNGKKYVGMTSRSVDIRWAEHISCARQNRRDSAIYNAIRKYGADSFTVEQVEQAETQLEILRLETEWILKLNTIDKEIGYNLTSGGIAPSPGPETRAKLSKSLKGKPAWNAGKTLTPEHRASLVPIWEARKGVNNFTPEGLQRLRESKLGQNNPNFGKRLTDEEKKQRSESRLGLFVGAENPCYSHHVSTEAIKQLTSIGFTQSKIAKMLGCSQGTVGNRLKGWICF